MSNPDGEKKIIIDEDWKTQVESEREQAIESEQAEAQLSPEEQAAQAGGMPATSFPSIINMLAMQAFAALGQIADPVSGHPIVRPDMARHFIDSLEVLQAKTKGNLDADETEMLENVIRELRMAFVAVQSGGAPGPG